MKLNITKAIELDVRKKFLKKLGLKIVNPKQSWWYRFWLKRRLKSFGLAKDVVDDIVENWSFTLGNKIYSSTFSAMAAQSKPFFLAHEADHSISQKGRVVKWVYKYYTDKNYRVECEARALCAEMEISKWLFGVVPDVNKMSKQLKPYKVGNAGIQYCATLLYSYKGAIQNGAHISQSAELMNSLLAEHVSK